MIQVSFWVTVFTLGYIPSSGIAGSYGSFTVSCTWNLHTVWYSHLLKDLPQFVVIHTVKGFSLINEAEVDVFLEMPYFSYYPADIGNLIFRSTASSKSNLCIWNFSVYVLLKPSLKDFDHYLASMWKECNCSVYNIL